MPEQVDFFWNDGWVVTENAVTPEQLAALVAQFDAWTEETAEAP